MHCLLQLHLNHTPNIRSTANYPLLQSMGNDKRHQRYKEQDAKIHRKSIIQSFWESFFSCEQNFYLSLLRQRVTFA